MTKRPSSRIVLPVERAGTSRRTFLKRAGYGVAAATLASCTRAPVRHVVPRLFGTEEAPAGRAYWIATTCGGCAAGCGVLARCVDGRPVKLEGIEGHPLSSGGLCAVGQAQVLSLYDSLRLGGPGTPAIDDAGIAAKLAQARGRVRLLTGTVSGPSTVAWIAAFCDRFGAKQVAYDVLSASPIAEAHRRTHGERRIPRYRFDRARAVAGFGADFLGTWISPVEFAAGWNRARRLDPASPRSTLHWQIEPTTSMTGLRADRRIALAPSETGNALAALCDAVAALAGTPQRVAAGAAPDWVAPLAAALWEVRGAALVVGDGLTADEQVLVNRTNDLLGSYGTTLDFSEASRARMGDDGALAALLDEMRSGAVGALVVAGCNPAYDLVSAGFGDAVAKVPYVVALASHADETAAVAHAVVPRLHALESWDDAEPVAGVYCLSQPAIPPLREGRTLRACLAKWCGDARDDGDLLRGHWRDAGLLSGEPGSFDAAFDRVLERGWCARPVARRRLPFDAGAVRAPAARPAPPAGALAVVAYAKVAMLDGSQAHNAWLQELPDPVSKVAWDDYACLSPATAERLGVATGDVVRVAPEGAPPLELPALVQEGQHDGVVAVALGYGRRGTDRFAKAGPDWIEARPTVAPGGTIGVSAAPLLVLDATGLRRDARTARVERTGARHPLALTQEHHSLHVPAHLAPKDGKVRDAVRTLPMATWAKDPAHAVARHEAGADLWPADHVPAGQRWGMVIDLAACNGCSACVVSCQAENNVPVVGRDEVLRHREMHWLRIDRYYEGEGGGVTASQQPMTCQHCANAPCETVCPVLATVHSSDGLNQQVYNRCVGTRYCANNCPYKVRRFNWFDYPREDSLQNLVLNPGVTVRTRGVMEKCSLCVQRIQEARIAAKRRGVPYADGDARTACQQSCPAGAIVFGDLNDPQSEASRRAADGRAYQVLAELNVRPAVSYLADVRNRPEGPESDGGH